MCEDVLRGVKRWVARSLFPPSTGISARLESLFTEFTVRCPQQPSGSVDCGAYVTLWARRLYEDIEDLTEDKLMRLVGAENEEGFKKEVIQLRQDMLRDLKAASRFPVVRREVIRQFGTELEDVIFSLKQAGGRAVGANLRGTALNMASAMGHLMKVVNGVEEAEAEALGAFLRALNCAKAGPTRRSGKRLPVPGVVCSGETVSPSTETGMHHCLPASLPA